MPDDIPVFYINMDRSTDRRTMFERNAQSSGLRIHRVQAVENVAFPYLGCCFSHTRAVHAAWMSGEPLAIVCEDDADFGGENDVTRRIAEILSSMSPEVSESWEVLQLQYTSEFIPRDIMLGIRDGTITGNVLLKGYLMGAVAYLMNRKGMNKFVSLMCAIPDPVHHPEQYTFRPNIDNPRARSEELVYRYLNSYTSLFPLLSYSINCSSTISDSVDYAHLNYKNYTLVRQLMEEIRKHGYTHAVVGVVELEYDVHHFFKDEDSNKFMLFLKTSVFPSSLSPPLLTE